MKGDKNPYGADLAHLYDNPVDYARKALQLRQHNATGSSIEVYQRIDQTGVTRRVVRDLNTDELLFYRIANGGSDKRIFSMFKPRNPANYVQQNLIQGEGYVLVPAP